MSVNIDQIDTEVTAVSGDLPLSEQQIEQLARVVMRRIEEKKRGESANRAATAIGRDNTPPIDVKD